MQWEIMATSIQQQNDIWFVLSGSLSRYETSNSSKIIPIEHAGHISLDYYRKVKQKGGKTKKIIKRTLGARIVKIKVRINLIASNSRIYIDFDSRKDNKTPKKFQQPKEQFYHLIIIQGERMTIKQGGSVLLREEKVYTSQSRPIFISFRKN